MTSEGEEPRPEDRDLIFAPPAPVIDAESPRADQRRQAFAILSVVVVFALVAAVVAGVALTHKSTPKPAALGVSQPGLLVGSAPPSVTAAPVAPDVLSALTTIPAAVDEQVGRGESTVGMKPISGPAMSIGGLPTVRFVGGLFCPYCAAERWSIIAALSRFGTFTGLSEIRSSEDNLATFDFAKAKYTGTFIHFKSVELEDQQLRPLQKLTIAQIALFKKYGHDSFPFLYLGGKYAQEGAGYAPATLEGLDHAQIAAALRDPTSATTRSIVGEANVLTAAICGITNNQPSQVCSGAAIVELGDGINGRSSA
jgi:Domain of unknown function (DUF929)